MRIFRIIFTTFAFLVILNSVGCGFGTTGVINQSFIVTDNNFQVVKSNAQAIATARYILTFIPIDSEDLYNEALTKLKKQLPDNNHGLINITTDQTMTTYLFYAVRKVVVIADIVKYGVPSPKDSLPQKDVSEAEVKDTDKKDSKPKGSTNKAETKIKKK